MTGPSKPAQDQEAVSHAQWERLRADLGAEALVRYADLYRDLLPDRIDAVRRAGEDGAGDRALRVLADLRTNSAMIGADRLARLAAAVEAGLRADPPSLDSRDLDALRQEAGVVDRTLGGMLYELVTYPRPPDQPPSGAPNR